MLTLTSRAVGDRRLLLLDLVFTFAVRPGNERRGDYAKIIWETETYRLDLLRRIQQADFFVILLTARPDKYASLSLQNIARHTGGWRPDRAIFNSANAEPPVWKVMALRRWIFPAFGEDRSKYLSLESNHLTRSALRAEGIETMTFQSWMSQDTQRSFDNF